MIAEATTNLLKDEISNKKNWRGDIKDVISVISKDEYWGQKLIDGEVFSAQGKDLWGNEVSIYRQDDQGGKWIVVESAGPDEDMTSKKDNISSIFYIPE